MEFKEWWESQGYNESLQINGVVLLAFYEIAEKAWNASKASIKVGDHDENAD